MLNINVLTE